jgi:hypothetical protein
LFCCEIRKVPTDMNEQSTRNWPRVFFFLSIVFGLVALTATYVSVHVRDFHNIGLMRLISQLTLGSENTLAVWWAGAVYTIAGLHALDAWLAKRHSPQRLAARGWLAIGLVLLILSFDEVGSLHERLPLIIPWGSVMALLPYAALVGSMLAFGLLALWLDGSQRWETFLMAVAFGLLMSLPLQEKLFLETNQGWLGIHKALRLTIEEGIEVVCALTLLGVTLRNSLTSRDPRDTAEQPALDTPVLYRRGIAVTALFLAPVVAWWNASLTDFQRGRPLGWFVATLCLFAAIIQLHSYLKHGRPTDTRRWSVVAIALMLSVEAVALNFIHTWRLMILFGATLAVYALTVGNVQGGTEPRRSLLLAGAAAATVGALQWPAFLMNLTMALAAVLVLFVADGKSPDGTHAT